MSTYSARPHVRYRSKADIAISRPDVRFTRWSQPVDATPGGQLAINTNDSLPNARPIAFGDSPRNQLSHNTIFSAAPHTTTKSLTYRPTLSIFSLYDKVLRRPVELAPESGHSAADPRRRCPFMSPRPK